MEKGTRVRVKDSSPLYAGQEATVVRVTYSAPIGSDWKDQSARTPVAEIRLSDGTTPHTVFSLETLEVL